MKNAYLALSLSSLLFANFCMAHSQVTDVYTPIESPTPWMRTRVDFLNNMPKQGVVAEIGVWRGHFSEMILRHSNPKKLYLIDCWEEQPSDEYPNDPTNRPTSVQDEYYAEVKRKFGRDSRVEILRMYSDEAAKFIADNSLDWVYIDANHAYKAVKNDIEVWFNKVKMGGFLAGDDYAKVVLWNNDQPHWESYGIIPAVNEFMKATDLTMAYLTVAEGHESWAIQKK